MYVDPQKNQSVFDNLDDEMARRVSYEQVSFSLDEVSEIMQILMQHNLECPHGYEILLEMFISESVEFVAENFSSMSKG